LQKPIGFLQSNSFTCGIICLIDNLVYWGDNQTMASQWRHPGGKLRELGPAGLTEAELLAILISPGIRGRPAMAIAAEIIDKFGSLEGLANQPLEGLLDIKGLSDVKIIRLAAAFELALRLARRTTRNDQGK
jgi:DNA repair protein RadC